MNEKNEWYLIPLWLIALVLVALRMFTPGLLPERVEWLPYLLVAICCGRNLAAAAPAFNPDVPEEEKRRAGVEPLLDVLGHRRSRARFSLLRFLHGSELCAPALAGSDDHYHNKSLAGKSQCIK